MSVAPRNQLDTVLQLADARREDLLGFVQEFIRERSPAPKIGAVAVASTTALAGATAHRPGLLRRGRDLGEGTSPATRTSWRFAVGAAMGGS